MFSFVVRVRICVFFKRDSSLANLIHDDGMLRQVSRLDAPEPIIIKYFAHYHKTITLLLKLFLLVNSSFTGCVRGFFMFPLFICVSDEIRISFMF